MLKSTMAKWAVAAMLAVPAVPMFAKTTHHKQLVHKSTHTPLISMSASRKHTMAHKTTRHVTYSTHRKSLSSAKTSSAHKLTHRPTVRHTSASTSPKFKVHVTKMPPTIDGINA